MGSFCKDFQSTYNKAVVPHIFVSITREFNLSDEEIGQCTKLLFYFGDKADFCREFVLECSGKILGTGSGRPTPTGN